MVAPATQQQLTIGQIRITYLPDGYAIFKPAAVFPTSSDEDWQHYQHLLNEDSLLVASIGSHLIQTPDRTILVDTSHGPRHTQNNIMTLQGGDLPASLQQAGVGFDDIDIVFYTHLHIDHVGWTGRLVDGKQVLTFSRARHLVCSAEWRRFDDPSVSRRGVDEALKLLEPCIEFVEDGQAIAPGVVVHATPGHTVGHAALVVTSGDERAFVMGDAFHSIAQFEHPEWTDIFDSDAELAKVTRRRLIAELAKPATYATGAHFADIIFGSLASLQNKYLWQPAEM
jgi:glyoxylase-like metal-dependent hydrolase (beta-lactamase superfamily II)